jgi:[glutamine synthetase] adenylyltransferase / [glutamine synthetase]-adenylyl-L-tyrosine phosphorylase
MHSLPLDQIPHLLQTEVSSQWSRLREAAHQQEVDADALLARHPPLAAQLARALAGSLYLAEQWRRNPMLLLQLADDGDFWCGIDADEFHQRLQKLLAGVDDEISLMRVLREFRQYHMQRIIFRDFNRLSDWQQTTEELSYLAETCIDSALLWHYLRLCKEFGTPIGRDSGMPQQMVVLGMGKLGAWELNLSSDIDLIFAFAEGGQTVGAARSLDNQEFFIRLGQRLIKALDAATADGIVFRTDMRLRPWGDSGALAYSFAALEEYYQTQGREWERYAMIKARVVAGDRVAGGELMAMLKPFVYRRYIDFSAFASLREMKALIARQVTRLGKTDDVKLGAGGIREVEFIAQAFQLIRGGRDGQLQERRVMNVLAALPERGLMPQDAVDELRAAYVFLRNTEHAIQGFHDKQTQLIPKDPMARMRIACVMGFPEWDVFYAELNRVRARVSSHFRDVIVEPAGTRAAEPKPEVVQWSSLWNAELSEDAAIALLTQHGFVDAADICSRLAALRSSRQIREMQVLGRERLDALMPALLMRVSLQEHSTATLMRIVPLIEAVARRSSYLLLLVENLGALEQLVLLCAASPWIAQQLTSTPALLDELLNTGTLYKAPAPADLAADLQQQVLRLNTDDLEAHMEALRYYRLSHVLRVAASEVTGKLPLMNVSDYLTWIAEAALTHVLNLAWQQLTHKHGFPHRDDGSVCDPDFVIVGYGKLGGIELGYGSDLDLVFIHDAASNGSTDGDKPTDNTSFFMRLAQRIIHILATSTPLGRLYEVDTRLRPSGASGLMVSTLKSFEQYQHDKAWTWEHQALTRARVVAGSGRLAQRFAAVRDAVLARPRDEAALKQDVVDIRQKMRDQLLPADIKGHERERFHLKLGAGGIVDIEFMVQYAVLAWAHQHPSLTRWTDNIRILETLADTGLMKAVTAQALTEAYKAFRAQAHKLALQQQAGVVDASEFEARRQQVLAQWRTLLGEDVTL